MRKSEWIDKLGIKVLPAGYRIMDASAKHIMVVKDIFTTRDGSWEPREGLPYSIPQWARDEYLRPTDAPNYFDDAGGDHHIFCMAISAGIPRVAKSVMAWSDGPGKINDTNYVGGTFLDAKPKSGWANIPLFDGSVYYPDMGQSGPWSVTTTEHGEVVTGIGMPNGWHVSVFIVWESVAVAQVPDIPTAPNFIGPAIVMDIRNSAWGELGIPFNRDAAFGKYASKNKMGFPVTDEVDVGEHRVQGFAAGIVYAKVGDWGNVAHIDW